MVLERSQLKKMKLSAAVLASITNAGTLPGTSHGVENDYVTACR